MTAQIQEETQKIQGFQSLKVSLIVAFLATSTVILAITGILELFFNFTILKQTGSTQQQLVAQEAAGDVESSIQEKFRILETGVKLGSLATASRDQQQLMLDKLLGLEPAFRQVVLLDTEDKELARVSRLSENASTLFTNQLTPDVLTSIRKSKEYIGSVYVDNLSNEPMVVIAVPNTGVLGNYRGALVAELNLKFMWDLVDQIKVGQRGQAYVVDKKGNLLAYTDVGRVIAGENLSKLEGVRGFVSGKEETSNLAGISKGIQNTFVVSKYVALNAPNWAVVVELSAVEAYQNTIQMIVILVFVTIIGFVFATVSGIILSNRISRPIINLKNAAAELSAGKLTTRIEINSQDEIGQLAQAFNQMAQRLSAYTGELEQKVKERTAELSTKLKELEESNKTAGESKRAMLNLLEDARTLEEDLKEERDRAKAILTSMGEGLIVIDKSFKAISINPQAAKLLEIPGEKSLNQPITALFSLLKGKVELPFRESPFAQIFQSTQPTQTQAIILDLEDDIYFKTQSGRKFPVALTVTPLRGDGITGAIIVFRDITAIKQLDEAKTGFISVASHQLRTPLTSMRWFSEMLIGGDAGKITDEQKHFVERIYQGTDRMIALVNLLLQIARVEAGRLKIEPMPINLRSTVQGVVLTLKTSLDKKSQKLEISSDPDPFPDIPMDQEVIWQVLQNLLTNASRYSPEKSTIFVSFTKKDGFAQCSVKDTGIGIPKSQEKRVFEKFFRAENALKMVPEGSGLGLSLVKLLVAGWGGKIWFESEEGRGTTFYFTIPMTGMKAKEGEVKLTV